MWWRKKSKRLHDNMINTNNLYGLLSNVVFLLSRWEFRHNVVFCFILALDDLMEKVKQKQSHFKRITLIYFCLQFRYITLNCSIACVICHCYLGFNSTFAVYRFTVHRSIPRIHTDWLLLFTVVVIPLLRIKYCSITHKIIPDAIGS